MANGGVRLVTGRLVVADEIATDAQNLALGVYAPLAGFVGREELQSIIEHERLPSGAIFPVPILLTTDVAVRDAEVALCAASAPEVPVATVRVDEVFEWDRAETAAAVFGTSDTAHPGVAAYHARGRYAIGGPVRLEAGASRPFPGANLTPDQARAHFAERGWRTVCAFQTRNVPHAGHEDLQKTVL